MVYIFVGRSDRLHSADKYQAPNTDYLFIPMKCSITLYSAYEVAVENTLETIQITELKTLIETKVVKSHHGKQFISLILFCMFTTRLETMEKPGQKFKFSPTSVTTL